MEFTFLKKLISRLSHDVFRPIPTGLLYVTLQAVSREISGECPWDMGQECQRGFSTYYRGPKCRNITCPGYLHPVGLISYTSRSNPLSSIDNRFDYNSWRWLTSDDFVPVGTLGAEIKLDFGTDSDAGGYGAGFYGAFYYGGNSISAGMYHAHIGDKWRIDCTAATGVVGPAIPLAVAGTYGPVVTRGTYRGDFDTYYIVEIIDYWGWIQNFNDAVLQICLATSTSEWVDYWGEYFGIPRLITKPATIVGTVSTYEDDSTYKARIMKEITRAKGTKAVVEEEANAYFGRTDVVAIEYHQNFTPPSLIGDDTIVPVSPPDVNWPPAAARQYNQPFPWPDPDPAWGLQPYQFYIFPPMQAFPSSKWIKAGASLMEPDPWTGLMTDGTTATGKLAVFTQEGTYYGGGYGYGYGYGDFVELTNVRIIDSLRNWMFIPPASVGEATYFGSIYRFSGLKLVFGTPIVYDDEDHPNPVPRPDGYLYDDTPAPEVYNQIEPSGFGVGGTYIWEFWNGLGWTTLTVTDTTTIVGHEFGRDGWVNWEMPIPASTWIKDNNVPLNIPNTGVNMYWIRCRVVTPPTTVPNLNFAGIVFAGSTNRGCYCATGVKGLPINGTATGGSATRLIDTTRNFVVAGIGAGDFVYNITDGGTLVVTGVTTTTNPFDTLMFAAGSTYGANDLYRVVTVAELTAALAYVAARQPITDPIISLYEPYMIAAYYGKRDIDNSYVYSGDSWARPEWESGLQGIIDRIKTAGTIAIINPPT